MIIQVEQVHGALKAVKQISQHAIELKIVRQDSRKRLSAFDALEGKLRRIELREAMQLQLWLHSILYQHPKLNTHSSVLIAQLCTHQMALLFLTNPPLPYKIPAGSICKAFAP